MKRKYDIKKLSEREKDILFEGYLIAMEEYSSLIKATKEFMDNYNFQKNISYIKGTNNSKVVDRKCSKCVNANNPVVCSCNIKDIAEKEGCDFWQDGSEDICLS